MTKCLAIESKCLTIFLEFIPRKIVDLCVSHVHTLCCQDERNARESVKREQDDAYQLSLAADRAKVSSSSVWKKNSQFVSEHEVNNFSRC